MAGACHVVLIAGTTVFGDGKETHLLLKGRRQSAREGHQHPGHVCLDGRDLPLWILMGLYPSGGPCADSSLFIQMGLDCGTEYGCSGQGQWSIQIFYVGRRF